MTARAPATFASAVALDLLAGEPPAPVHPVVWIGRLIAALERHAPKSGAAQLAYGAAMSASVLGVAAAGAALLPRLLPASARPVAEVPLLKSAFAVRGLLAAAESVRRPLVEGRIEAAREALRSLVSRPVEELTPDLVAAAAIESLAENLTDSALAPWLAYALLGLPGAAAYRALNTLDSMVGYRGRYEYLGKAAARADDLANLVPARLGALLIAAAAPAGGGSVRRAWRTARRDHRRTASPNAGWTMAAMAGALGVTLEKTGHYRLGDGREPGPGDIRRAQRVVAAALALGAGLTLALAGLIGRGRGAGTRRTADG